MDQSDFWGAVSSIFLIFLFYILYNICYGKIMCKHGFFPLLSCIQDRGSLSNKINVLAQNVWHVCFMYHWVSLDQL